MNPPPTARVSFKEQMLQAREDAIVAAVNRLLAEKGFDAMTVDEVAAQVGVAKASLYKHFPSKEALAAAAMAKVMQRAQAHIRSIAAERPPLDKLKAMAHWTMTLLLSGEMPSLPHQNSSLRATLMQTPPYIDGLMDVSDQLGEWITAAQQEGSLNPDLPPIVVLYTMYARACDPVVEFLKIGGQHTDEQIVDLVLGTCFDGLRAR